MMTQWENAVTAKTQVSHDPVIPILPLIPHVIHYSDRSEELTIRGISTTNLQNLKEG